MLAYTAGNISDLEAFNVYFVEKPILPRVIPEEQPSRGFWQGCS
jgi:hypothetical protein